jgi:hypothetical protein
MTEEEKDKLFISGNIMISRYEIEDILGIDMSYYDDNAMEAIVDEIDIVINLQDKPFEDIDECEYWDIVEKVLENK